jgi:hypothetical protein
VKITFANFPGRQILIDQQVDDLFKVFMDKIFAILFNSNQDVASLVQKSLNFFDVLAAVNGIISNLHQIGADSAGDDVLGLRCYIFN